MKTKSLMFVSCLAAGALMASPAIGKPAKKSSVSKPKMARQTTQVTRHNQNIRPRMGNTRYYGGTRYTGTRSYAGRQYRGTRYYGGAPYYSNNYYGGTPYYYNGSSAVWPYVAASVAPYVASSLWAPGYNRYPYSYYGSYPYGGYNNYYSSYGGYPYGGYSNRYSYYTPTYSYSGSTVAAVQQRLGRLGYYHGGVDGVIGPQTRNAIAGFQSRNGLAVDGTISRPLLNRLGLA